MRAFKKLDKHAIYLNELVVQVAAEMGRPSDINFASRSVEGVLQAVRNRLSFEQSVKFLDLLPLPFKAVYIKDWNVCDHIPDRIETMEDFINEVCTHTPDLCENEYQDRQKVKEAIRSVFKVIGLHVSKADLDRKLAFLPQDLRLYLEAEGVSLKSNPMLTSIWLS